MHLACVFVIAVLIAAVAMEVHHVKTDSAAARVQKAEWLDESMQHIHVWKLNTQQEVSMPIHKCLCGVCISI